MTQSSTEPKTTAEEAGEGSLQPAGRSWLDRYFHISDRGSSIAQEVRGGITMGIGMFVALIGLVKAGFVGRGPEHGPPLTLGLDGQLQGWPVLFFAITLLLIFMLQARNVPGAILIGITVGTVLSVAANAV